MRGQKQKTVERLAEYLDYGETSEELEDNPMAEFLNGLMHALVRRLFC